MAQKTIRISEEVYEKLKKIRMENESISDVINRVLEAKIEPSKDIRKAHGLWKDLPEEVIKIMQTAHRELRDEINKKFK